MTVKISSSEAASTFSQLLKRVRENGDSFIIEEGGQEVCAITPLEHYARPKTLGEFVKLLNSLPRVDEDYLQAVERYVNESNVPKVPPFRWG